MAGNWVRQRSRWIKGYLQTLLVHLRRPVTLARTAGVRRAAAFALLVGGPVMTSLLAPPLFATVLAALMLPGLLPEWVLWVGLVDLLAGRRLDDLRRHVPDAAQPRVLAAALGSGVHGALAAGDEAAPPDRPRPGRPGFPSRPGVAGQSVTAEAVVNCAES